MARVGRGAADDVVLALVAGGVVRALVALDVVLARLAAERVARRGVTRHSGSFRSGRSSLSSSPFGASSVPARVPEPGPPVAFWQFAVPRAGLDAVGVGDGAPLPWPSRMSSPPLPVIVSGPLSPGSAEKPSAPADLLHVEEEDVAELRAAARRRRPCAGRRSASRRRRAAAGSGRCRPRSHRCRRPCRRRCRPRSRRSRRGASRRTASDRACRHGSRRGRRSRPSRRRRCRPRRGCRGSCRRRRCPRCSRRSDGVCRQVEIGVVTADRVVRHPGRRGDPRWPRR